MFQKHLPIVQIFQLQWAPLNGTTLEPRQTDPINRMIQLTGKYCDINSKQALNIVLKMIPLTELSH
jgi:hypothetical protein